MKAKCQKSKPLTHIKNTFGGLIIRLTIIEEMISKPENVSKETPQTEIPKKKN